MKTFKQLLFATVALFIISCSSVVKFPVSKEAPAADITVKMTKDENKNYIIELTARYLASADRLNPPKENYLIWVVTENKETKKIGKMIVENAKKASFKTSVPFVVKEIFITAEDDSRVSVPSGIEIARTKIK